MSEAKRDENRVPTLIGISVSDEETIQNVYVKTDHSLCMNSGGSFSPTKSNTQAKRDENRVPVLMGVSSVDGVTPVAAYTDGNNNLLISI